MTFAVDSALDPFRGQLFILFGFTTIHARYDVHVNKWSLKAGNRNVPEIFSKLLFKNKFIATKRPAM